jgi:transcriptional regulator with XRE-family HTH domain
MAEPSVIGRRLKAFRRRAKMTQKDLSDATGIPRSMIAAVESGLRSGMSVESLIKIADVLGLSLDQLAREDPKQSERVAAGA